MQPVPTYEDLPVVFSAATQVEIPDPTIDTGYGEGVALPTEHFSWLEYKVTQKIDELATSTLSLLGEMDSYLGSRGVTPSGASVTQFQTALAAQIAAASVASAATCTGNSATATTATNALACSGNAATATNADKVDGMHRDTYTFNVPAAGADVTISIPVGRFSKIKALSGSFDAGTSKYPFNMTADDGSRTMTISVYATSSDILRITSSTTLAGSYVGKPGVVVVDYTD